MEIGEFREKDSLPDLLDLPVNLANWLATRVNSGIGRTSRGDRVSDESGGGACGQGKGKEGTERLGGQHAGEVETRPRRLHRVVQHRAAILGSDVLEEVAGAHERD